MYLLLILSTYILASQIGDISTATSLECLGNLGSTAMTLSSTVSIE